MPVEPSDRTAMVAGVWSALGFVPIGEWLEDSHAESGVLRGIAWLTLAIAFLWAPMRYLVVGMPAAPFGRFWMFDAEERKRNWKVTRRGLIWFLTAATVGSVWSLILGACAALLR
jgi:hypothetical protein